MNPEKSRDFEIGITAFFELKRRVQTTETAAEDEDTSFCHGYLILPSEIFPGHSSDGCSLSGTQSVFSVRIGLSRSLPLDNRGISVPMETPRLLQSVYKSDGQAKKFQSGSITVLDLLGRVARPILILLDAN
jgi:hypothetical protein